MSEATIKYNGSTIASVDGGDSVTLATQGKYMSGNVTVEVADGGGVVTRQVIFARNDADAMYYTDATMTPQSITSGNRDINAELPVGSLVVYARTGISPPMPSPSETSGVQKIATYSVGKSGEINIYEVLPE